MDFIDIYVYDTKLLIKTQEKRELKKRRMCQGNNITEKELV